MADGKAYLSSVIDRHDGKIVACIAGYGPSAQLADTMLEKAAAEGFSSGMRAGSVYPERWEERTCGEVLALIDECIHWYDHDRIKQSLGWMSPVQYRLSHELAA